IPPLRQYFLYEAWGGIEPPYKGFADPCLATWLPCQLKIIFSIYYFPSPSNNLSIRSCFNMASSNVKRTAGMCFNRNASFAYTLNSCCHVLNLFKKTPTRAVGKMEINTSA